MITTKKIIISGLAVLILTAACFGSSIPTSAPGAVDTIVAATMKAITPPATATSLPASLPATATVAPTLSPNIPTPLLSTATRINFLTDATTGVVSAPIQPGQVQYYVINAAQDQIMYLTVTSLNNDVTLSVKTQGGTSMLNQAARQSTWQARLPQTEDYYIGIYGGASSGNYTLSIEIPSRIKFAVGATSAKLTGTTVAGYVVAYAVLALKNQKMTIYLNSLSNGAVLAVIGFSDGQHYLSESSDKTSYVLRLPATQDYIIEVVPKAGKVVFYDMELIILN
jgi:hypothetical protein